MPKGDNIEAEGTVVDITILPTLNSFSHKTPIMLL